MKHLTIVTLTAVSALAQTAPSVPQKASGAGTARAPGLYAIINTSMGTITAKLFEKEAPVTVANFVALAKGTKRWKDPKTGKMVAKPLYKDITFYEMHKFMIVTGDPTGTGTHDCGFTIKDEFAPSLNFDQPGRLAMSNGGTPNSGACRFFITRAAKPSLKRLNAIFGQVVEGQEIVDKIADVPADPTFTKPLKAVKVIDIAIQRIGPPPVATKKAKE